MEMYQLSMVACPLAAYGGLINPWCQIREIIYAVSQTVLEMITKPLQYTNYIFFTGEFGIVYRAHVVQSPGKPKSLEWGRRMSKSTIRVSFDNLPNVVAVKTLKG